MNRLAFPLACALTVASADAANIVFVSFHAPTDAPSAAASDPAYGLTRAPDAGYTDLLRNAGHTVTRYLTRDIPEANVLNAADLVIISRSVPSGNYELDAETAAWNGITAPTMILGGYILRNNRLGYTTGTTIPDTTSPTVTLSATNPNHPIYSGITLQGGTSLNYATAVNSPAGTAQRGISVNTNPLAGGGVALGTVGNAGDPAVGGMLIGEWQAGATMGTTPADTLGGHRLVFLTGSREPGVAPNSAETAGMYDLTPEGAQLFLNAVNYMAVPEPSTYALLGLGGMALLLRRRKA